MNQARQDNDKEDITITESTGNVYKDAGYRNPDDALLKSRIAMQIYYAVKERELTQQEAAEIMGTDHAKVSRILSGKLRGFTTDRLLRYLVALGVDVEIKIKNKPKSRKEAALKVVVSQ